MHRRSARRRPLLPARRCARGLTVVELMVAVALLAVVLAVAAPQFSQWGRATRVSAHASDLQSALAYARSESQRRGVRVTVCTSLSTASAVPSCSPSANWDSGWLVFVDNVHLPGNLPGTVDGNDSVLRIGEPALNSVVATAGNLGSWLAYSPQGLVRTEAGPASGAFTICQAPHGRRIAVSPVGLINLTSQACP